MVGGPSTLDDFSTPNEPPNATKEAPPQPPLYHAYFASGLTNVTEEKDKAQLRMLRATVEKACANYRIHLYVPGDFTDPDKHRELDAQYVYNRDRENVSKADLLVLVANWPSFGAGQELEIARNALIPIIALNPQGNPLSRMVHGAPTFKTVIEYESIDAVGPQLEAELAKKYPIFEEARKTRAAAMQELVGSKVREWRKRRNLSVRALADRVGVTAEEIERLEEDLLVVPNPSVLTLSRVAQALDVSLTTLLNPDLESRYARLATELLPGAEEVVVGARGRATIPEADRAVIRRRVVAAFHERALR